MLFPVQMYYTRKQASDAKLLNDNANQRELFSFTAIIG